MDSPAIPLPPYTASKAPPSPAPPPSPTSPAATPPSTKKKPSISPSPLHLSNYIANPNHIHELIYSPSPKRRTKPRAAPEEILESAVTPRKKRRGRSAVMAAAAAAGFSGCVSSPRVGVRRARRRLEKEIVVVREEREGVNGEEEGGVKGRRRRQSKNSKVSHAQAQSQTQSQSQNDKSLVPFVAPPSDPSNDHTLPETGTKTEDKNSNLSPLDLFYELIMWKNIAKSTLWFGIGSIFFLSTSFSRELSFSVISTTCHLAILILGLAFLRDSVPQRKQVKCDTSFQLTEHDIIRVSRFILPIANATISKSQMLFSGDPSMTLKVLPVLLFGAKYGYMLTPWRILATGFFFSFTVPKLYSCYSQQIHKGVESVKDRVMEAWRNCPRKKFVAATAATMFWNLFSVKTRILAAFISVVILRLHHQQPKRELSSDDAMGIKQEEQEKQAMEVEN